MRRHIALLVLIVAIVVAIALFRPQRPVQTLNFKPQIPQPRTESTAAEVAPRDGESDEPPAPSGPPVAIKKEAAGKTEPTPPIPARPSILTVLNPDGAPVADAIVFSVEHSYSQMSSQSKVREWRTDEKGELKLTLGRYDSAHFVSYKVDVGAGIAGPVRFEGDVTLKYEKSLTVTFKCIAPEGLVLEGAEVILTTEVLLGLRRDEFGNEKAVVVSIPPRMLLTDREGVCKFGAVLPPRQAKSGWPPVPGFCHAIKATWYSMKARETLEKPPAGPVTLVLQQ